jgi:hypothetical protein
VLWVTLIELSACIGANIIDALAASMNATAAATVSVILVFDNVLIC